MTTRVLILPGYQNSGPQHWQSLWQQRPQSRNVVVQRVMQADWDAPVCSDWYARLCEEITEAVEDVIIVAHSLGCLLTAHLMRQNDPNIVGKIKGALLVAPPDSAGTYFPVSASGFSPDTAQHLSFPSIVVASSDDPYGALIYAQACAAQWGSHFINIGERGHINADSGLDDWSEGWALIAPWLSAS